MGLYVNPTDTTKEEWLTADDRSGVGERLLVAHKI